MSGDLKLHPAQAEIARHPARFKVVVAGRRFGKCLSSGSMIQMADGSLKPISDVQVGEWVLTINEQTYQKEFKRISGKQCNGEREVFKLSTRKRSIIGTSNHPLLINNQWVEMADIQPGDLLGVISATTFGDRPLPDYEIDLLAIWLAEGSMYTISNGTQLIRDTFEQAAKQLSPDLQLVKNKSASPYDFHLTNGLGVGWHGSHYHHGSSNAFRLYLEDLGLWGCNSKTKFIPEAIFQLPKPQLARFLNRFIGCDGCITKKSKRTYAVECGLANEHMVRQLSQLFAKFGIRGQIYHKVHKKLDRHGNPYQSWNWLCSNAEQVATFCREIDALSKEDKVASVLAVIKDNGPSTNEYLPIGYDEFVGKMHSLPERELGKYGGYNAVVARGLPEDVKEHLNSWRKQTRTRCTPQRYQQLRETVDGCFDPVAFGDVAWEPVLSIESAGVELTWDIEIEDNHNFIVEGAVSHNSMLCLNRMITQASLAKNQRIWYVAPSFRMAKQIMWRELKRQVPKAWLARKPNETELSIELKNGTELACKGGDNPDSLRGVRLDLVVLDEVEDMRTEIWQECIRPTLADSGGSALFIGTPKNYGMLYDLYIQGMDLNKPQWASWQFPTIASPFIPKFEIEQAKQDMDPRTFRQEFLASFESVSGRVYYPFTRQLHVNDYVVFNPKLPIWVGMDFNIDPMSLAIIQLQPDGTLWIVDEIVQFNSNVDEAAEELSRRYWRYQKQTTIYPDPAGKARQHARGETSLDILREHGFARIKYRRKHPAVDDRINAVNRQLLTANGDVNVQVAPHCKHVIRSLEQTMYKEGSRDVNKAMSVEHITDAIGYCIEYEFPMRKIYVAGYSI